PKAGRRRLTQVLGKILATLAQEGFAVEPLPTAGPGEATAMARDLAAQGRVEVVFAFGGDGTVREVAAGLLGSRVALGVLPGGTVNLLAHSLGLPRNPVRAAALLARLPSRALDVGLAGDSPFLMMVSAGLDTHILAALDQDWKSRFGKAAVVLQGLREWWRYGYPRLELTADGLPCGATFAAVSNIAFYGGPFQFAPGARPDDRQLDLVLFRGSGRAATLGFVLGVIGGLHTRRRDVSVQPADEVVLTGPAGTPVQVDGDLCRETLPVRIRLSPERLLVLSPEGVPVPAHR
ncbi:MAG: diacylglycerol kinase family lipid kinase, partial [Acidobacteriota bacterium]|nr:diacylglycerol kinase family lipid kinase [Acidobacteriota bacterium]